MKLLSAGALLLLMFSMAPVAAHATKNHTSHPPTGIDRGSVYHQALGMYDYDPKVPLFVEIDKTKKYPECMMMHITYVSANGEHVPAVYFEPLRASMWHPAPAVILLHGLNESKEDLVPFGHFLAATGYASLIIDEWGHGERKPVNQPAGTPLQEALAIHGFVQTVIDVRRGIDFLQTRPHINPHRIGIVGFSLGAIIGADAMGIDDRLSAAVLVSGGGDVGLVLKHLVAQSPSAASALRNMDWNAANTALKVIDPLTFAPGIGTRPVLMQNGTDDLIVPSACADALYDAISGHRNSQAEIDWFTGFGHIQPTADTDVAHVLTFSQVYPHMRIWLQKNLKGDSVLTEQAPSL